MGEVPLDRDKSLPPDQAVSVAAHEAGHTMGMLDGYNTKTLLPLIDPATGLPRDDIMAKVLGPVTGANINELLTKNKVCKCQ